MERSHPLDLRAAHLLHDHRLVDVLAVMVVSAAAAGAGESAAKQCSIEVRTGPREEEEEEEEGWSCLRFNRHDHRDHDDDLLLRLPRFPLSLSALGVSLYSIYYLTLEPFAGLAWIGSVGLPSLVGAFMFRHVIPDAWMYALLLHVFGWYLQVAVAQLERLID
ncbi:MAG: hypothetical protein AAF206_05305 [Bacteroidota bacterium]